MDPEEVEEREFLVTLRGYSRDEVEAFKSEVAGHIRGLTAELAATAEELNNVKARLDEALSRPQADPKARSAQDAEEQASPNRELAFKQVAQETERILMAAEQVAEQMHARARQESAEILTDARRQAQHGFDQVEESKRRAERDLESIRESRGLIASQMEDIRRRLDETINRLRIPVESPVTPVRPRGFREDRQRALQGTEQAQPVAGPQPADPAQETSRREQDRKLKQIAERQAQEIAERQAQERAAKETKQPAAAERAEKPAQSIQGAKAEPQPAAEPRSVPDSPAAQDASVTEKPATDAKPPPAKAPVPDESHTEPPPAEPTKGALDDLLEEFRRKRAEDPETKVSEREESLTAEHQPVQEVPDSSEKSGTGEDLSGPLEQRTEALSDLPNQASRRLKRLLQEEHNDILDRLRTKKAKGDAEQVVASTDEQLARFSDGLGKVLGEAFHHGRRSAGGDGKGGATAAVGRLIAGQVVKPLRHEVTGAIQAGLDADDTAASVAERASDVFRVWKGVRTELLGEGMAYAAFHQGQLDHWTGEPGVQKVWVASEEDECPGDVCTKNADAGPMDLKAAFPSGHVLPPAHGGCLCALIEARSPENH